MQAESEKTNDAFLLLEGIRDSLPEDDCWFPYLTELLGESSHEKSVHLGIFNQPYLDSLLLGKKTIESRFSSVRCAPYHSVKSGDIILVKRSSGPIVAMFRAGEVWNHRLNSLSWMAIKHRFGDAICPANSGFWRENESAVYATLIEVEHVRYLGAIPWNKSDRRGWVVLHHRRITNPTLFE